MKCPFCSYEDTQVVDSRVSEANDSIRLTWLRMP